MLAADCEVESEGNCRRHKMSHFAQQFGECIDIGRAYGAGRSISALASEPGCPVALSTMKAALSGQRIRPSSLHALREAFALAPLWWIETKIRWAELTLDSYLVEFTNAQAERGFHHADVGRAFRDRQPAFHDADIFRRRLRTFLNRRLPVRSGRLLALTNAVGCAQKRDMHTVSYPTATAARRGATIRPTKFSLICRRAGIAGADASVARILFAEAQLGEYLLGDDPLVFKRLSKVDFPRTVAVLTFSAENAQNLT